jgi:DNA-binding NarL/FixJ family response regulator
LKHCAPVVVVDLMRSMQNSSLLQPINLLLVDDHAIVTDGLKALLEGEEKFTIKGEASNGKDALQMLRMLKVDVVLLDVDMPVMNGIDCAKMILRDFPDVRIIMLTMHDEKEMIRLLLDMGVHGYLLKNSSKDELHHAIEDVINDRNYISEQAGRILLQPDLKPELPVDLTDREIEIVKLIAEGLSNKEIGEQLFISHRTVDTHRTNLMTKIGVHNVAGIVRFAILHGLVS